MDTSVRWVVGLVVVIVLLAALVFLRGAANRDIPGVSPSPTAGAIGLSV